MFGRLWKYPERREHYIRHADGRKRFSLVLTSERTSCVWRSSERAIETERRWNGIVHL
jgi:hypothetical protein